MNRIALTTFSPEGYEVYGRRFIDSFVQYWNIPLWVFYQGKKPPEKDGVTYVNLQEDDEYMEFLDQHKDNPFANGFRDGKIDYRYQAVKFCHKVFAETSPYRPDCDQWIWIDADVETFRPVDANFFDLGCPRDYIASYLGRRDWHHSECGFMCYNIPLANTFLKEFRRTYTSGEIFTLDEWHDSFVWDVVRGAMVPPFFNLSEGIGGVDVWPHTILGEYMSHAKGPKQKIKTYGATL